MTIFLKVTFTSHMPHSLSEMFLLSPLSQSYAPFDYFISTYVALYFVAFYDVLLFHLHFTVIDKF